MNKNWNNIGKVFRENREGKISVFSNLTDALLNIRPDEIDEVNKRFFIYRHYTKEYIYNGHRYGGYWSYGGDKFIIRDELGLAIPRWKIEEVYATIPRSRYGWALSVYANLRCAKVYKFRDGPVPGIRNWHGGARAPQKLWQALKTDYFDKHDEELKEYKFKRRDYGDKFDDFHSWDRYHDDYKNRNWKSYRKHQWKEK